MNNILIRPNPERDPDFFYTKEVIACLQDKHIFASEVFAPQLGKEIIPLAPNALYENIDTVIALGGDGTLLSAAREAAAYDLPVLGINLGHLGFLADVEKENIRHHLAQFCQGAYTVENRMMLQATLRRENGEEIVFHALNDIVVSRFQSTRLIDVNLYIDGDFVDDYKADGMIVATPTGSTAYSMSAGGPIIDPEVKSFVITPICPHKLYAKTIVVPDTKEIVMTISNQNPRPAVVNYDGQKNVSFAQGDTLTFSRSPHKARLIKVSGNRFYSVLHHKLLGKEN